MRRGARWAGAIVVAFAAEGLAHPMGDVSVNHYAGIEVSPDRIEVKYLLDLAEIPSQEELSRVDPDRDDRVTPEEREAYLELRTEEVLARLRLEVNGSRLPLRSVWRNLSFPPGERGLSTVRTAWRFEADLPDRLRERNFLVWNDSNHEEQGGWKEIRITGADGIAIGKSSLANRASSGELSSFPDELVAAPPTDTKAWCQFGAAESRPPSEPPPAPPPSRPRATSRWLLAMIAGAVFVGGIAAWRRR